jgi:hypothetical protein
VGQQRPLGEVWDFIGEVSFTALEGLEERISFRWGNGKEEGRENVECGGGSLVLVRGSCYGSDRNRLRDVCIVLSKYSSFVSPLFLRPLEISRDI